ncbi:MAG: SpoIIE family protein phosphatase [Tissierellia bacterium]|nr:SpoIIE family protein phosphatase [Tissierellia bacterium]
MNYLFGVENELKNIDILNYDILDSIADWVRVVDTTNTVIYANRAMKREYDKDIVGKKCYSTKCGDHNSKNCITSRSIETGQIIQKEIVIRDKNYSAKASPIVNDSGEIIAAVEVFRDVTREKKLEKELLEKNKIINNDLALAKRIQNAILPSNDDLEGVSFDYIYKASNTLSGDIFDIYDIGKNCVGVYICDVAGHGVAAAIITMFIRQTMRTISHYGVSPSNTLSFLHQKFCKLDLEAEYYFTMFYGIYDKDNKRFKYSNAGHNCIPFLYDDDNNIIMLESNGYPIVNILKNIKYENKEVEVKAGDKILLYTDGITEAKNKYGKEFGEDRVKKLLLENRDDLLDQIVKKLNSFIYDEQMDDFAAVLIDIE